MDILSIAEENFLISFGIVLAIGLLQGSILGKGIRQRFPSLKLHARRFSIILLILFSINSIFNILKFMYPDKITYSEFTTPQNMEEIILFVVDVLGLNAGFGAVVGIFVSILLILIFRFAKIPKFAKYFIFTISVIMVLIAGISRFTDYLPTQFQILMYVFYQIGLTIGIFVVTRRKETDLVSEFK